METKVLRTAAVDIVENGGAVAREVAVTAAPGMAALEGAETRLLMPPRPAWPRAAMVRNS